jgi:undecaprenyl-diphosphatase
MSDIQQWGIEFILMLQTYQSPFLDGFFYLITQLGGFAYLLIIPLFIWCIEPRLGIRALLAMMIAQYIVMLLKDIVQEPRPFTVDNRIISDGEHGLSFPSGHAMGSMVFYGLLILWTNKNWLRWLLVAMIFLIGLSRNYLGVHYPHDVIAGWILGLIYLYGWLRLQKSAANSLYTMSLPKQLFLSIFTPALVGTVHFYLFSYVGALVVAGSISACLLCLIIDKKNPLLKVEGGLTKKIGRYSVGIALTLATLLSFQSILPEENSFFYNTMVWTNGFVLTIVIGYLSPQVFKKIKLAGQ